MDDLISRQAAIDALRYAQHRFTVADEAGGMGTVKWSEDVIYFAAAERVLSELPPAQPANCSEFPNNSDTISRQAAIDAVGVNTWAGARIMQLPSAQPGWIPCSERLPKKYGNYLITTGEGEVDLGSYDPDRPGSWSACDAKGFHWVWDVTAWMPLPEAYK